MQHFRVLLQQLARAGHPGQHALQVPIVAQQRLVQLKVPVPDAPDGDAVRDRLEPQADLVNELTQVGFGFVDGVNF